MNAAGPVYMELVDFVAHGSTVEQVANFRPSAESLRRLAELLDRQRESNLTDAETSGLDNYVRLESILGWPKPKRS